MVLIILFSFLGIFIGYLLNQKRRFVFFVEKTTNIFIFVFIFVLGVTVGVKDDVIKNIVNIGLQSLILAVSVVSGSILATTVFFKYLTKGIKEDSGTPLQVNDGGSALKYSLKVLFVFILGIFSGIILSKNGYTISAKWALYALYVLLILTGISIGAYEDIMAMIKKMRPNTLLMPFFTIAGTFTGAVFVSVFIPGLSVKESLTVGSGFGYYSIAGVMVAQLCGSKLGAIALLANMMRELITLAFTPQFVKYINQLAPIASGGATTMDSTLPVITRFTQKQYAVLSIYSGIFFTVFVPVIITLVVKIL